LTRSPDRRIEIPTQISPEATGEGAVEVTEARVGDGMTTIGDGMTTIRDGMTTIGDGGKVAVATTLSDRVMTAMTVDGVPMIERIHVLETPTAAIVIRNPIIRTDVRGDVARKILIERLSTTATFRLGILQYLLL
jgi:hypothetical protein